MMTVSDMLGSRPIAMLPERLGSLSTITRDRPSAGHGWNGSRPVYEGVPAWEDNGIAVIEISGALLSGPGGWGFPFVSFYEDIAYALDAALDNPSVKGIALQIDSPGGVVSGLFTLAEHIFQARKKKPIIAIIADEAYSAAYALACAASSIAVPAAGGVGSIGTLMVYGTSHRMLNASGIDVTVFRFGEHKAELSGIEALTEGAVVRAQAQIDSLGEMFISHVAKCRNLDAGRIRDTKAETFLGQDGVSLGLADNVMAPREALRMFGSAIT